MKNLIICIILLSTSGICAQTSFDSESVLQSRFQTFAEGPSELRLRALLNSRTDGETSYLWMALVGEAFGNHPDQFELVANNLKTRREHEAIRLLREWKSGVFEYYPEKKPKGFDDTLESATWMTSTQAEQAGAGNPIPPQVD